MSELMVDIIVQSSLSIIIISIFIVLFTPYILELTNRLFLTTKKNKYFFGYPYIFGFVYGLIFGDMFTFGQNPEITSFNLFIVLKNIPTEYFSVTVLNILLSLFYANVHGMMLSPLSVWIFIKYVLLYLFIRNRIKNMNKNNSENIMGMIKENKIKRVEF